ncbi:MAG: hypothetical protein GY851_11915 [bacterium]|nr:hypothetical protein [bacterium]
MSLSSLVLSGAACAEDPVYFADAKLKALVETKLGVTDPTPTDMLDLTSLFAFGGTAEASRSQADPISQ